MPDPTPFAPEIWYAVGGPGEREMIQDEDTARVVGAGCGAYSVVPVVVAPLTKWNEMIYALQVASEDDGLVCFCGDEDGEGFQMCAKCRIKALAPFLSLLEKHDG